MPSKTWKTRIQMVYKEQCRRNPQTQVQLSQLINNERGGKSIVSLHCFPCKQLPGRAENQRFPPAIPAALLTLSSGKQAGKPSLEELPVVVWVVGGVVFLL